VHRELGAGAELFLVELERALPPGYHARRILAFRERYQTDDVIAAMAHAQQYGVFEYHASERSQRSQRSAGSTSTC